MLPTQQTGEATGLVAPACPRQLFQQEVFLHEKYIGPGGRLVAESPRCVPLAGNRQRTAQSIQPVWLLRWKRRSLYPKRRAACLSIERDAIFLVCRRSRKT